MLYEILVLLIPGLPLLGFVLLGLFGRSFFKKAAGPLATGLMLVSFALALKVAIDYFSVPGSVYEAIVPAQVTWLRFSGFLSIAMGLLLDPVSVMMIVVVTFISLLVHIYSLAYMKGEERYATYYSFLSLFTFSMLGLVLSSNLFQLYIFWELVGVSSFLLIGFYYQKPSAVAAAKKAFIVTRFADLGFLVGILAISYYGGTLDFNSLITTLTAPGSNELATAASASFLGVSALTWSLLLIFFGGAGKSAMFPLHIWLPDAMEGPTPVSALIHAATMVVAGVFLVARLFPVFSMSAVALETVTWVGAISAIFAAVIACTQTDIKRVLAYSTMSQIGFMMFSLGVSGYGGDAGLGYTASMFHLFTHAMFKALLFLGAGVVIHYVHSNEMAGMGGLRKQLPVTHLTFLIGCLAISGIPPLSGFFSKEEILLAAYQGNRVIYWLALLTSGLTAFYMFRLYFTIFWSKPPAEKQNSHGEGNLAMMLPLVLLGTAAVFAGFVPFGKFVSADGRPLETSLHPVFSIAPVLIAVAGILAAYWLYKKQNDRPARWSASLGKLYQAAHHKFYIDEIYQFITKKIVFGLLGRPAAWIDRNIVDGTMNLVGSTTQVLSESIKKWQSGKVQLYAMYFLIAVIGMVVFLLYAWK